MGLVCGIAGESLLFVQRQCRQLEYMLVEDFRVLAFLGTDMTESRAKVIEEKIRSLPGVKEIRYVSRESALASLQEQAPELLRSVALLGENPLHAGYEIRLTPEAIVQIPSWIQSFLEVGGLVDVRYKPLQVTAIMQMQFYNRFLNLTLSLAALVWLMGAIASFWIAVSRPESRQAFQEALPSVGAAGLGVLIGMGLVFLAAYPLRSVNQMWVWPSLGSHGILLFLGFLGAGFLPEVKWTQISRGHERHGRVSHEDSQEEKPVEKEKEAEPAPGESIEAEL